MDANDFPWQITATMSDGTTRTTSHAHDAGFGPFGAARHISRQPNVARVDVATSFVAGEQVTPGTTEG